MVLGGRPENASKMKRKNNNVWLIKSVDTGLSILKRAILKKRENDHYIKVNAIKSKK